MSYDSVLCYVASKYRWNAPVCFEEDCTLSLECTKEKINKMSMEDPMAVLMGLNISLGTKYKEVVSPVRGAFSRGHASCASSTLVYAGDTGNDTVMCLFTLGAEVKFCSSGREDCDVRMLGRGRCSRPLTCRPRASSEF